MSTNKSSKTILALCLSLLPVLANAHHPNGYKLPASMTEGLLSGLGHPIIDFQHLLFIIGIGIFAYALRQRRLLPSVFILSTLLGTFLHLNKINIPYVEAMVAVSIALLGVMLVAGWYRKPAGIALAITGIVHGYAYAESIIGAETTALVAYLAGFGVIQLLICLATGLLCQSLANSKMLSKTLLSRVYGLVALCGGAYFLV